MHRLACLFQRIIKLSFFTGSLLSSFSLILRIRRDHCAVQTVDYCGSALNFRGYDELALYEVLVDEEYKFLKELLISISEPLVLDVGAHIGSFAIWVFGVNSKANILSVEADPETHKVISLNKSSFVQEGARWEVIHKAAARQDGSILRLSNEGPSMSHHISLDGDVEVPGISLLALLNRLASDGGNVDLVKIDIEGSEEAFLFAAPDALERVDSLVIELHPHLCDTVRVQTLLAGYFNRIEDIGGRQSSKPLLYCRR